MSTLDYFLGARLPESNALGGSARQPRTLMFPDGVQLHLQEDESASHIIFFSLPGVMADVQWLAGHKAPWRTGQAHPQFAGVQSVLTVEPERGQVYLIDVCERAVLDKPLFEQLLADHVARHLRWQVLFEINDESLLDNEYLGMSI